MVVASIQVHRPWIFMMDEYLQVVKKQSSLILITGKTVKYNVNLWLIKNPFHADCIRIFQIKQNYLSFLLRSLDNVEEKILQFQ